MALQTRGGIGGYISGIDFCSDSFFFDDLGWVDRWNDLVQLR